MSDKNTPWTELYRPSNLGQVVGNEDAVAALRKWFDSWKPNTKRKAALLHGPAGIGKTSSVVALATERGYEVVEMNASDSRNKKAILAIAGSSAKEGSLVTGAAAKRILLIDEVDGITGREDRGGVSTLIKVIKAASVPIICTANDAYKKKLSPLRKISKVIAYRPVHKEYIIKILKRIIRDQQIDISTDDLSFIAENAAGDMRSAINDLQGMVLQLQSGSSSSAELLQPMRDKTKKVEDALTTLFTAPDFIAGKKAVDGLSIKYDTLLLWIFENAYKHVSKDNLPEMYDTLAAADRFLGRIRRRQSWRLLSYFFDLISGGVAVAADKPRPGASHTYPQKIAILGRTHFSRALQNSIAASVAEKAHISTAAAKTENLYLVEQIMNSSVGNAAELAFWLELDSNQIKSLVSDKKALPRIKKVIKAFEEERASNQTSMRELKHSSFDRMGDDWTEVLKDWETKKEVLVEKEKQRKKELKKRKAATRKAKKEAEKKKKKAGAKAKEKKKQKTEKESKEADEEDKPKQVSLDKFFS